MVARWGLFFVLQGALLHLSWPALVARRSGCVVCCFWIEAEDLVFSVGVVCGLWLLNCNFSFLAMVARREAAARRSRPLLVDFCLQGATEMQKKLSFERNTWCSSSTP
jgi:hypothetical protein